MKRKDNTPPEDVIKAFLAEAKRRKLADRQTADSLGMSYTTVSRLRSGTYEGSLDAVADRAALALRLWKEREAAVGIPFLETALARRVFAACDFALTRQTPVILTGLSQMGKTTALEAYASRSDAVVRVLRMPAATTLQGFCEELTRALNLPKTRNLAERRERILGALNARTLLIIDELHELVLSATRLQTRKVCEFLRECWDRTHCGLVLCGTDSLQRDLLEGPDAGLLDQIVQRAIAVKLPRRLSEADIRAVAEAAGMVGEPEADLMRLLKSTMRMNRLCLLCAMTVEAARKRSQEPTWALWLQTKTALLGD